jgi:hypothetical protein
LLQLSLCMLLPSLQYDMMQSGVCYLPYVTRECCVTLWVIFIFFVSGGLSDCEPLSYSLFSLYINPALIVLKENVL